MVENVWIRDFPGQPCYGKAGRDSYGKRKGAPEYWVAVVVPGRIMFEMSKIICQIED